MFSNEGFNNKLPTSRKTKDLLSFIFILILTISFSSYYIASDEFAREEFFSEFTIEYLEEVSNEQVMITGSNYVPYDQKIEFSCIFPNTIDNVWIKYGQKTNWILLDNNGSFRLTKTSQNRVSDNITIYLRCDDIITEFSTITYNPDVSIVQIYNRTLISEDNQPCLVYFKPLKDAYYSSNKWAYKNLFADIKIRGDNNGYFLELNEKYSVFDMRKDDDWVLIPSKEIGGALRTKLSIDLYNMLYSTNKFAKLPNCEIVELFIDGIYNGVYVFMEPIDRKHFENILNENNEELEILLKSNDWFGDFFQNSELIENAWEIKYNKTENPLQELYNLEYFIQNANEEQFFDEVSGIFSKVDKNQLIDLFLFDIFTGHNTIEGHNYYIFKGNQSYSKFCILPWDFDISWSYSGKTKLNTMYWINTEFNNLDFINMSYLFHRLLSPRDNDHSHNFINEMKARWAFIRNTVWGARNINSLFNNLYIKYNNCLKRVNTITQISELNANINSWINLRLEKLDNIDFLPLKMQPIAAGVNSPSKESGLFFENNTSSRFLKWEIYFPQNTIRAQYFINDTMDIPLEESWVDLPINNNLTIKNFRLYNPGYYNFTIRCSNNTDNWTTQFSGISRILPQIIPEIYITCNENIGYNNVNCVVEIDRHDNSDLDPIPSLIDLRGGSSSCWVKKSFHIQLSQKKSLFGMRDDDDWILYASYMDHSRMRIKFCYDLWNNAINDSDKEFKTFLPQTRNVNIFLNGEYYGLFLIAERMDNKLLNLDPSTYNTNSSALLQSFGCTFQTSNPVYPWEQKYPDYSQINFQEELTQLTQFVETSSDLEFFDETNGVFSRFDKDSLIDFFLFLVMSVNPDTWWKNYFICRQTKPGKWFLIPWDFDGCFGQWGWYDNYNENDSLMSWASINYLFRRLIYNTSFKQDCITRWNYLRSEHWSDTTMMRMLNELYSEIEEYLPIDMELWKPITVEGSISPVWPDLFLYSNKEFNVQDAIVRIFDFVPKRVAFLDNFFNNQWI